MNFNASKETFKENHAWLTSIITCSPKRCMYYSNKWNIRGGLVVAVVYLYKAKKRDFLSFFYFISFFFLFFSSFILSSILNQIGDSLLCKGNYSFLPLCPRTEQMLCARQKKIKWFPLIVLTLCAIKGTKFAYNLFWSV